MAGAGITRRWFLAGTLGSAGAVAMAANARRARPLRRSANEKLNVAAIGGGGKGSSDILNCAAAGENVVALCDLDWNARSSAKETLAKVPNVPRYTDYRVMLEKHKDIDAVTISTPDHTH